ncbi:MAG TPA: phosphoribosylanthranilate isomerase, partial [Stellaceae bacterium]|nr:phosphoribosylanthranilate isomerase [Stellaceae bacterium]
MTRTNAIAVKICGLSTPEAVAAAVDGGAAMVGFVFYPRSPRAIPPAVAAGLAGAVPGHVIRVGLFVDPDDALLDRVLGEVPLDLVQLHGEEAVERVAAIRRRAGLPVMKALKIAGPADLDRAAGYADVADRLLFDAASPAGSAALPGGNGLAFDWRLLAGRSWPIPWMLSGGLTVANLAEAVATTGTRAVDVSSGVETTPGRKDMGLIREFLAAARSIAG